MPLEEGVHKMTGLPAERFGIADSGVIAPGRRADLTVFDPARIGSAATYEQPELPPRGIRQVFIAGRAVFPA
jgi:N-acyl-D-aspartate/D-glutamate deacylase